MAPAPTEAATLALNTQKLEAEKKQFAADITRGLRRKYKQLSSKYFYDGIGSQLFKQIMALPEYYLTRTETEIFRKQRAEIVYCFLTQKSFFHLLDLGAGDAAKTKILLCYLHEHNHNFDYIPIDISEDALQNLQTSLNREMPDLAVHPLADDYFNALDWVQKHKPARKVLLFLGSNIGNFETKTISQFTLKLRQYLNPGDQVLMGFDLQKDPQVIRQAYDDAAGVTAAFNYNLLHRINHEFNGNFDLNNFKHFAEYNPVTGNMKSYLMSTVTQKVYLAALKQEFSFAAWEAIHTETSHKFTLPEIEALAQNTGFSIYQVFTDDKRYFADVLLEVV